ncbi:McrC family protein [Tenacibaculum sp. Mcav3-52]|uniref:McrC family protein n=1 Tax=Tenacibaculum sp. Mcav3-52 TaxID=2917762 RepID=UPI001EF342B9|nr:McrC family protein [Tenacibaculum sp. Mcav3-52]MCG7501712.1 McrC family protein [Tenacibaculum sp. Mcav3-52]
MKTTKIQVFEHQRLRVGEYHFEQQHLDALLKLNEFHNWSYFKPIAKGIQFTQFVGVIQINGLLIEIHPKADKSDSDLKWQKVLLHMLQACGKLKASSFTGAANVKRSSLNLLEVYFELFLTEIQRLQKNGLVKQYRKQTKNTKALKGKLEFAGHLQKNLVHKEHFYTTHQVYDTNHLLHKVLAKAIDIIGQFTKGTYLYDFYKRVNLNFPEVDKKAITIQQLQSIKLSRKTKDYEYALELARLIILNYSPDISGGREKMLSLLFDMNVLWETFVLKQLQKECRGTTIEVYGQESKLFWGSNSLRPDIVLRTEGKTFIIDTKWKRPSNLKASVEDLRQMYAYNRFWDAGKALLLYPGDYKNNAFFDYQTEEYLKDGNTMKHQCKMGFVSVVNEVGELSNAVGSQLLKIIGIKT